MSARALDGLGLDFVDAQVVRQLLDALRVTSYSRAPRVRALIVVEVGEDGRDRGFYVSQYVSHEVPVVLDAVEPD